MEWVMAEALLIKEFTVALAMVCRDTVLTESMVAMALAVIYLQVREAFQCIIKIRESRLTCLSATEEEGAPATLNL